MQPKTKARILTATFFSLIAVAAAVLFSALAGAQTKVSPALIKPGTVQGIYIGIVGQGVVLAQIDPNSPISVNTSTIPPTISFLSIPVTHVPTNVAVNHLTAPQSVFVLSPPVTHADTLEVTVGGLVMSPTEDYSLAGSTVTLKTAAQQDDVVSMRYQ